MVNKSDSIVARVGTATIIGGVDDNVHAKKNTLKQPHMEQAGIDSEFQSIVSMNQKSGR